MVTSAQLNFKRAMAHARRSAKGHHGPQRSCPAPRRHSRGHHSRSQAAMRNLHVPCPRHHCLSERGRPASSARCARAWPREGQRGGRGRRSKRLDPWTPARPKTASTSRLKNHGRRGMTCELNWRSQRCCEGAAGRRAREAAWRSRRCRYCRGPNGPEANERREACLRCRICHHSRSQVAEAEARSQARHDRKANLEARRCHRRHRLRLHRREGVEDPRRLGKGSVCVHHIGEGAPVIHATEKGGSMSSAPHQPGADAVRLEREVVDDYLEVVELVLCVERVHPLRVNCDELASKGAVHVVAPRRPDETVVEHRAPQQQHTRHTFLAQCFEQSIGALHTLIEPREASDQIIGENTVATLGLLRGLCREQQPQPLSRRRLILEGRLRPNRR
ncbi:hypothetical protein T492DRAFT_1090691 [Pavlovales sp. CCMP2436]|nr:hypothetical protein T492DRAFT_1090691 [Pavlovales sp. CCMP2436]|mmetsp:Transcript_22409/g.56856  ORF Transcript_22409/g.56856 Transcript_22409/m.56856 type:complete len:390 (+) Transcript_22409:52-1221(+)